MLRPMLFLTAVLALLLPIGRILMGGKNHTPAIDPLWTFTLQSGGISHVLADGNLVYLVKNSDDGQIYALDGISGRKLWSRKIDIQEQHRLHGNLVPLAEPLASGGLLYYMAADECVHAVEGRSGQELWRYGPLFSLLGSDKDTVFVLDQDRRLTLLDKYGRVRQRLPVTGAECTEIRFNSDTIITRCMGTSSQQAFSAKTGQMLWTADLEAGFLLLSHGIVYGRKGDRIAALDAVTGKQMWTYSVRPFPESHVVDIQRLLVDDATVDRVLYVLVFDAQGGQRFLQVLDGQAGALRMSHKLAWTQEWRGEATVFDGILYVDRYKDHDFWSGFSGRIDSALSAVDIATGQELWRSPWCAQWFAPPVAAQGRV
jgi:outer membrane protein assembly factor BamB